MSCRLECEMFILWIDESFVRFCFILNNSLEASNYLKRSFKEFCGIMINLNHRHGQQNLHQKARAAVRVK